MQKTGTLWRLLAIVLALVLVAAACGDDDDSTDAAGDDASEPAAEEPAAEEPAADDGGDAITDISLAWLKNERDKSKPFFLMHQFKAPHDMFNNAKRYVNISRTWRSPSQATCTINQPRDSVPSRLVSSAPASPRLIRAGDWLAGWAFKTCPPATPASTTTTSSRAEARPGLLCG